MDDPACVCVTLGGSLLVMLVLDPCGWSVRCTAASRSPHGLPPFAECFVAIGLVVSVVHSGLSCR
eukprot:5642770-Amphidinium_carterae.1